MCVFGFLQGVWVHPEIDNPEYSADSNLYLKEEVCAIGFDLWQVKSGTIFGNILIADDIQAAKEFGDTVWKPMFVSILPQMRHRMRYVLKWLTK